MIILLSPSKTLDFSSLASETPYSQPDHLEKSFLLIKALRRFNDQQLMELMDISPKIAELNTERYRQFAVPFTIENAKPALFAFKGDVYTDIDVQHYTQKQLEFAQEHVRILSGLYGLLRPLDLIQPYRLEMGTKLAGKHGKNLYDFWGESLTTDLNAQLKDHTSPLIINLASIEYFSAIQPKLLNGKPITIHFKEHKNGTYKIIGLFAKRARGAMADFIIKNKIDTVEGLKGFTTHGYHWEAPLSTEDELVFVRG